jgi:hypothetical protein
MPKHTWAADRLGWLIGLGRRAPDPEQRPGRSLPPPRPSVIVGTGVGATEGAARSHLPHTVPVDRFSEKS